MTEAQTKVLTLLRDGWRVIWDHNGDAGGLSGYSYKCAAWKSGGVSRVNWQALRALEARGLIVNTGSQWCAVYALTEAGQSHSPTTLCQGRTS